MRQSVEYCLQKAQKCIDQAGWSRDRQAQDSLAQQAAEWLRLAEEARTFGADDFPDAPRLYVHQGP